MRFARFVWIPALVLLLAVALKHAASRLALGGFGIFEAVHFRLPKSATEGPQVGLSLLFNGSDSVVDIILIHGLNGHRERTWTAANGVLWARDLLPQDLPRARIYSWGYDARVASANAISSQKMHDHAENLLSELALVRTSTNTSRRPIIFMAHSLGGIILKRALILCDLARAGHLEKYKAIKVSTRSVYFFGTPHQGGNGVQIADLVLNVLSAVLNTNTNMLRHLSLDSENLDLLTREFVGLSSDFEIKFFYEMLKTDIPGAASMTIVKKTSAVLPGIMDAEIFGLPADHRQLVRYESRDSHAYEVVSGHLAQSILSATEFVANAWAVYDDMRDIQLHKARFNITFPFPHHRNPYFVGRQKSMLKLRNNLLSSENEKHTRSKVAVLSGVGGIGKTQLLIEYIHTHRSEYASILWIESASKSLIQSSFERAANVLMNDFKRNKHRSIHSLTGAFTAFESATTDDRATRAVELVLGWLSHSDNDYWLVVFDSYDNLEEIDIQEFMPTPEKCHIIVTSRRPEAGRLGFHISLDLFSPEDATVLLLKSARQDVSQDSTSNKENISAAQDIARELGYLPLALDQAGSYIYAQQISMDEYLPKLLSNFKRVSSRKPKANWSYGKTLFNTWELSLQAIQRKNPTAVAILTLCAFLGPENVALDTFLPLAAYEPSFYYNGNGSQKLQDLAEAAFSNKRTASVAQMIERFDNMWIDTKENLDETLELLFSYSLAQRRETNGISIHPLVKLWIVERLEKSEKAQAARDAVVVVAEAHQRQTYEHNLIVKDFSRFFYPQIQRCRELIRQYLSKELPTTEDQILLLSVERLVVDFIYSRNAHAAVSLLQHLTDNPLSRARTYAIFMADPTFFPHFLEVNAPPGPLIASFANDSTSVFQVAEVQFLFWSEFDVQSDFYRIALDLLKSAKHTSSKVVTPKYNAIVERQELWTNFTRLEISLNTPFRHRNAYEESRGELERLERITWVLIDQVQIFSDLLDRQGKEKGVFPVQSLADFCGYLHHPLAQHYASRQPPGETIKGLSPVAEDFITDAFLSKCEKLIKDCMMGVLSLSQEFYSVPMHLLQSLYYARNLLELERTYHLPRDYLRDKKAKQMYLTMEADSYSAEEKMDFLESKFSLTTFLTDDPGPYEYEVKLFYLVNLLKAKKAYVEEEGLKKCLSLEMLLHAGQTILEGARLRFLNPISVPVDPRLQLGLNGQWEICDNETDSNHLLQISLRPDRNEILKNIYGPDLERMTPKDQVPLSWKQTNEEMSAQSRSRSWLSQIAPVYGFFAWLLTLTGVFGRLVRVIIPAAIGQSLGLLLWEILCQIFFFIFSSRRPSLQALIWNLFVVQIPMVCLEIALREMLLEFLTPYQLHILLVLTLMVKIAWYWLQRR